MKLKDKLAIGFTQKPRSSDYYAYLAGFEKARELAILELNKQFQGSYNESWTVNGNYSSSRSPFSIGDTLKNLGEEEVK
jgi:hypothetical protein